VDYLNLLRDASLLETASLSDKLIGCLIVTIIGMGITFTALLILWVSMIIMSRLLNPKKKEEAVKVIKQETVKDISEVLEEEEEDIEELVAVISAAIASSLNTSIHNIIVQNIVRVPDEKPAWNKVGIIDQINTRF